MSVAWVYSSKLQKRKRMQKRKEGRKRKREVGRKKEGCKFKINPSISNLLALKLRKISHVSN
jgi:hypothetical protein